MKLCTCNKCGHVFEDLNPGCESINYPDSDQFTPLVKLFSDAGDHSSGYWGCPNCLTDEFLIDNVSQTTVPPSQEPEMTDCGTVSRFAQLWTKGCMFFGSDTPARMAEDFSLLTEVFRADTAENHLSLNISF